MTTEETDPTVATVATTPHEPATLAAEPPLHHAPAESALAAVPPVAESALAAEPDAADESEAPAEPAPPPSNKRWYVIKVASNREDSTKRNIERQMRIDGLETYFGQIVIPYEEVVEVKKVTDTTKAGDKTTKTKKVIKKVKKFPGYLMAEVEWNAEVQAMLRGVSGVSGFVGEQPGKQGIGKPPPPMTDADVQRMLGTHSGGSGGGATGGTGGGSTQEGGKKLKEVVKLNFEKGDKVRIKDGAFAGFEGLVKGITEPKEAGETPIVTVGVQVLGRETSIEMEFWQVDKL